MDFDFRRKIYVGGVSRYINLDDIKHYFKKCGSILEISYQADRYKNTGLGHALIVYKDT